MHNSGFISSQNRSGQVEKDKKKKLSFRSFLHDPERDGTGQVEKEKKNYCSNSSFPTQNRKFQ